MKYNRRSILKAAGVSLGLPFLESLFPWSQKVHAAANPLRSIILYMPNGVVEWDWTPQQNGFGYSLPSRLAPLNEFRSRLIFPKGLRQYSAGGHAKVAGSFLTSGAPLQTTGAPRVTGKSADQKIADFLSSQGGSPIRHLNLCGNAPDIHSDSSQFSKAYSQNISWRSATVPDDRIVDPQVLFDKIFTGGFGGGGGASNPELAEYRLKTRKSVLDGVLSQIQDLNRQLGTSDIQKMDQYTTSIREVERSLQSVGSGDNGGGSCNSIPRPSGGLSFDQSLRAMLDVAILGLACGKTRSLTYLLAPEGYWHGLPFTGTSSSHHQVSHYNNGNAGDSGGDIGAFRKINYWYAQQFAYFLTKMKSYSEGGGDLLSNSMVVFGPGMHNADTHSGTNIPLILAGEAGGKWKSGRALDIGQVPLSNLWLTMMRTAGMSDGKHGDSSGTFNLG